MVVIRGGFKRFTGLTDARGPQALFSTFKKTTVKISSTVAHAGVGNYPKLFTQMSEQRTTALMNKISISF